MIKPRSPHFKMQDSLIRWGQYMGMVFAFIVVWQLLSKSASIVHGLF